MSSLSCPMYRMNRCISFWSLFHMFIMQSFHFSFCFHEIQSLIRWFLNTFFIQLEYPTFLVSSSFLSWFTKRVVSQCKFVILNNLLPSPPNFWQRLAVFVVLVPSFQNGFVPTMHGLASFQRHLLGFVVHSLPFGSSMFGTTVMVLFDDVTWNWWGVEVLLVQLVGTLQRFQTPTWTIHNANFPI